MSNCLQQSKSLLLVAILMSLLACIMIYDKYLNLTPNSMNPRQRINNSIPNSIPVFILSDKFVGARKGYVFKTENGKTGYYVDKLAR